MIDPDGFFLKLFPTVWAELNIDSVDQVIEIGLPLETLNQMPTTEVHSRLVASVTLRIVESALSQVKKIREDRDRDFQRNHR